MHRKRIFWDLETSDLFADWGSIFCIGYEVEGEGIKCISITDFPGWEKRPWDDTAVIASFLKVLQRDDIGMEVTHYGTLFDLPYLQARMTANGQGVLPLVAHFDTYFAAKSKLKIKSRSLKNVAEHAGVRFKKTALDPRVWKMAARADKQSLDYIVDHCIADIRVLKAVYKVVAPMMRKHPSINDYGACHNCGKDTLQRRGYYTSTSRGRQIRYACTSCGAWTHRPEKKEAA